MPCAGQFLQKSLRISVQICHMLGSHMADIAKIRASEIFESVVMSWIREIVYIMCAA